jgi:hypothetical protein
MILYKTKIISIILIIAITSTFFNQLIVESKEYINEKESEIWAIIITVGDIKRDQFGEKSLTDILSIQEIPQKNIKKIIEENATKQNILNEPFQWIKSNEINEEDIILFYFSMHGIRIEDKYPFDEPDGFDECIIPYDYKNNSNYIVDEELNDKINSIDNENIVLIFETCFSGGMIDGEKDLSNSGRIIITSSDANESSWPMYLQKKWLFPNYFFQGLYGSADLNKDNIISAEEAYKYAELPTIKRSSIFAFIYSFIPFIPHDFHPQHPQIYDGWPNNEDNHKELTLINLK